MHTSNNKQCTPGLNALKRSTLGFCGIATSRILALGPVKDSSPEQRSEWRTGRTLGFSLRGGAENHSARVRSKLLAWTKALRPQFYPMTWLAYMVGALGALAVTGHWDLGLYWPGYAGLFFGKAATAFTNEWFDYDSDRRNSRYGPFNGGSRVLVNGELSFRELKSAIIVSLAAATAFAGLLLERLDGDDMAVTLAVHLLALASAIGAAGGPADQRPAHTARYPAGIAALGATPCRVNPFPAGPRVAAATRRPPGQPDGRVPELHHLVQPDSPAAAERPRSDAAQYYPCCFRQSTRCCPSWRIKRK